MTDPRIAALAEALSATMERPDSGVAWPTRWTHDDFAWVARQLASPLIAALPPDWCGHGQAWSLADEVEIARLRTIEEAAREWRDRKNDLFAATENAADDPGSVGLWKMAGARFHVAEADLRAALEADR